MTTAEAHERAHPLRVAFAARDFDGVAAALAPDVVLRSPITSAVRFEGRDEVTSLLREVREVLEELEYVQDFGDGDEHVLVFRARAGGGRLDGVDVLRLDDDGRVREITVFMRPLTGLTALTAVLAPRLARRRGRGRAALVAAMARPLALLTRAGDVTTARLAIGNRVTRV
jgi:hypothetical protein